MNSMADNIGGNTLHSWAEIVWEDKRGRQVKNRGSTEDNIATMGVKCNCLRFLFIDEIEACGLCTIADTEEAVRKNTGQLFRMDKDSGLPRVFGGLNVLCLGDFWQLPPTGQISSMSNPYGNQVLECAKHHSVMSMF